MVYIFAIVFRIKIIVLLTRIMLIPPETDTTQFPGLSSIVDVVDSPSVVVLTLFVPLVPRVVDHHHHHRPHADHHQQGTTADA